MGQIGTVTNWPALVSRNARWSPLASCCQVEMQAPVYRFSAFSKESKKSVCVCVCS